MKKDRVLLRVIRAAHEPKITQSQLARAAGLSAARYWQIEHGEGSRPTDAERAAIASALDVRVSSVAWPEFESRQVAS